MSKNMPGVRGAKNRPQPSKVWVFCQSCRTRGATNSLIVGKKRSIEACADCQKKTRQQ